MSPYLKRAVIILYTHIIYIYIVYISLGILQYILMFKTHILMVVVKQGTPCIDLC
jgi:hypothetical protein